MSYRKSILNSLIVLFLLGGVTISAQAVKGLWVVRDVLKSRAEIDKMLDFSGKAGITDIFLQVRGRGDAYYKSALVPMADGLDPSFDPLAYVLQRSKDKPYKIHLWLNVFYLWSADKMPGDSAHILLRHPEWTAVSKSGKRMSEVDLDTLKRQNTEGVFISPANQEFQDYFDAVIDELLSHYTFAGIHLDYIRYPDKVYDYSESMRSKFMLEYQADPIALPDTGWSAQPWIEFRKNIVSSWIKAVSSHLKSRNPEVQLSAAVWADLREAQNRVLQDWPSWVKNGYLDFAVLMNYASDNLVFENRVREAIDQCGKDLASVKIVMGVSLYNQSVQSAEEKMSICRKYALRGLSYFSYETIRTNPTYYKKIQTTR